MKTYHILNGDSLNNIFPNKLQGEKIICRECLVDGNVKGESLEALYINRAQFLSSYFPDKNISIEDYKSVSSEFEKIQAIPENAAINLWFEEDLFCQVNLWFILYLLKKNQKSYTIHLVLPSKAYPYSFYEMPKEELETSFENRLKITTEELLKISNFWNLYKAANYLVIDKLAKSLGNKYLFLLPAIKALQENRPKKVLKEILKENEDADFWTIFNQFKEKEGVYGFGDLQVKRLLAEIAAEK